LSFFFSILFPRGKLTKIPRGIAGNFISDKNQSEKEAPRMATVICISNEKGGTGKSLTSASLSIGLARQGKKVLAIDADPQGSLTVSLGNRQPDKLPVTLAAIMGNILNEKPFDPAEGIIRHEEGIDLMPANFALANTELALVPAMGRETILRQYVEMVKPYYSHIILDTLCA
jgi:chromosome partitioning protein